MNGAWVLGMPSDSLSVTEQDPTGPARTDLSPISSALAPLLSTQIILSHAYFLNFSDAKNHHQMEEINYLMIMSM